MRNPVIRSLSLAVCAALSTSAIAATQPSFDVKEIDTSISPCADFNGFVNSKWVAANPIPADRTRWGAFDALREESLTTQRDIAEAAARDAAHAASGSISQKVGWYYHSGMAEGAIEKAGLSPLKPELTRNRRAQVARRDRQLPQRQLRARTGWPVPGRTPRGFQEFVDADRLCIPGWSGPAHA